MECKNCGTMLEEDQTVCPVCQAEQETTSPTEKEATPAVEQETAPAMISLCALNTQAENQKQPFTAVQIAWRALCIALAVVVFSVGVSFALSQSLTSFVGKYKSDAPELDEDNLGINGNLPTSGVTNIALFGLDTRKNDDSGRSDAMIILSIDHKNTKIKLTSLGRDTLVPIEGYWTSDGRSKLTHAWAFGKAQAAVKTINQNFGMNITDYAYVNFYEFAEIIDYIGGVYIDVNYSEMGVMNRTYAPYIRRQGIHCPDVTMTGMQKLCGGQALAYARNRYTGSDIQRGDRQKEVLMAMFDAAKDISITKYPTVIKKILSICHTTLTADELMGMAKWAIAKHPTFENFNLPCPEVHAKGGVVGQHGWVWSYDLNLAAALLHDFIYDDNTSYNVTPTTGAYNPARPVTTAKGPSVITRTTTGTTTLPTGSTTMPTGSTTLPSGTTTTVTVTPSVTDPTGTDSTDPTDVITDPTDVITDPSGETDPTGTDATDATDVVATTDPTNSTTATGDATTAPTTAPTTPAPIE